MTRPQLINWRGFSEHRSSALTLLAANVLPLLGVLFWGWSTFSVVVVYWVENVVIGLINVLKMLFCKNPQGDRPEFAEIHTMEAMTAKVFLSCFFTVHYGGFCAVHGVFVFALLGGAGGGMGAPFGNGLRQGEFLRETGAIWGIAALAVSHFYSFVRNYLIAGEFRRVSLSQLMVKPYGRIVVLHVAILLGAFAAFGLGSPVWILVLLIAGKTALDLAMHLREHTQGPHSPGSRSPGSRSPDLEDQGDQGSDGKNRGNEGFDAGA